MSKADQIAMLVAGLAVAVSGAVQAESHREEPGSAKELLPELTTTARRTEENVLEIPVATTTFSASQIREAGINSFDDVAANTPGLSLQNFFGQDLNKPVIRGVAPVAIFGESSTAVYIDGIYVSSSTGINFGFLDIERIEVVKGPQGAQFGNNAFSGAVNYVTKTPGDEFSADAELQIGEDGKQLLRGTISGPLVDGLLSGSLSGLYDDYDGAYDNASGRSQDIGGHEYKAFSTSLFFTPNDAVSAKWNLYVADDQIDPPAQFTTPANCEASSSARFQNYCGDLPSIDKGDLATIAGESGQTREVVRTSLKVDWDTDYGTFSSLTGYSKTKDQTFANGNPGSTSTIFSYAPDPTVTIGNTPFPPNFNLFETRLFDAGGLLQNSIGKVENEDISQEFRFTSPKENRTRYSAGAYYFKQDEEIPLVDITVSAENPLPADFVVPVNFSFPQLPGDSQFCGLCIDFIPATLTSSGQAFNPIPAFLPLSDRWFATPTFLPWFSGAAPSLTGYSNTETTDWALFGSVEHDFTDVLTGYAEIRYTDREIEKEALDAFGAPRPISDDKYDTDYMTWRTSLSWAMSDTQNLYGSIATGEKGGGLDSFIVRDTGTPMDGSEAVYEFDNESNTTYELGYKAAYNDGKVIVDSAVYFIDWEDIVLRNLLTALPDGTPIQPVGVSQNLGNAEVWGVELGINAKFTDRLSGGLGFSYNDTEMTDGKSDRYEDYPSFGPDGDVSGQEIPRQPDTQVNVNLTWRDQLTGDWEWYVRGDAFYQSEWYLDLPNQATVPDRTIVNARIGMESEKYTIELYSTNLFDDDTPVGGFRDVYFSTVTQDTLRNTFFPPRISVAHPQRRLIALRLIGRFGG